MNVISATPIDPVQTGELVAGLRGQVAGDQRQRAAEPAVADVVRQRERRVADLRRERLDQECRDRSVHHRHVDDLDEHEQRQHDHGRVLRIGRGVDHRVVDRQIRERGDEVAGHHDLQAADLVRQRAEDGEERHAEQDRDRDDRRRLHDVDLHDALQERQRVELARVPDDALAGGRAEEDEQHDLEVGPVAEAFLERLRRRLPLTLERRVERRLLQLQADVERHRDEDDRQQERNAPAPGLEVGVGHHRLDAEDDAERDEEAERGRDLDEARVEAALVVGNVLGDIDGRAAVLTAESETLQKAKQEKDDRCRVADLLVRRQKADQERRQSHDRQRDHERVLASDQIADAAEDERAERTDDEAGREERPRLDQIPRWDSGRGRAART